MLKQMNPVVQSSWWKSKQWRHDTFILIAVFVYLLCSLPAQAAKTYQLYISPTPRHAEIKILNIKPKFRQGIRLPVGRYEVLVNASGYTARRFWVKLSNRSRRILVTLKPSKNNTARLFITPQPAHARIQILNIKPKFEQGISLSPGVYEVQVSASRFVTHRQKVRMKNKDVRLNITLDIEDSLENMLRQPPVLSAPVDTITDTEPVERYPVYIKTEPSDAQVNLLNNPTHFVQGVLLAPGRYQLKVSKVGYTPRMRWFEVKAEALHLDVHLSEPEFCFAQQQALGKQQQYRHVRLHFYLQYVEAWYRAQVLPNGPEHTFRLLGSREGNTIDLLGTAYYGQEVVELRSQMQLEDDQLLMLFDGQQQRLQKVACGAE